MSKEETLFNMGATAFKLLDKCEAHLNNRNPKDMALRCEILSFFDSVRSSGCIPEEVISAALDLKQIKLVPQSDEKVAEFVDLLRSISDDADRVQVESNQTYMRKAAKLIEELMNGAAMQIAREREGKDLNKARNLSDLLAYSIYGDGDPDHAMLKYIEDLEEGQQKDEVRKEWVRKREKASKQSAPKQIEPDTLANLKDWRDHLTEKRHPITLTLNRVIAFLE